MATFAALAVGFVSPAVADTDCDKASAQFASAVSSKPEDLLTLLADAVAKNESCSCEIVQAAVKSAKGDKAKVGDIVFTVVSIAPARAVTVAECAIAVAPGAESEIQSALKSALSDEGEPYVGGKGVDKGGKYVEPPEEPSGFDFGRAPLDVRGIYLLAPSPGGGVLQQDIIKIIEKIRDTGIDPNDVDGDGVPNDVDEDPFDPNNKNRVTPGDPRHKGP